MLTLRTIVLVITTLFCWSISVAQSDSSVAVLTTVPDKYISTIDKKIDRYSHRISSKTEKTLTKLSKWENKIKNTLQKVNPEAANNLFGNNQLTFNSLLQKIKQGEAIKLEYQQEYNKYRDDLTTNIKYLEKQKDFLENSVAKKVKMTGEKIQKLNELSDSTDAIQEFIRERKKQLISTAFQYIAKSKYLTKINKEVWYYAETMKNYKQLFSDEEKTEKLVKDVLNKVPGFQQFVRKNSMFYSIFGSSGDMVSINGIAGLQTRSSIQNLLQQKIVGQAGSAQQVVSQSISSAQGALNQLKQKLNNPPIGSGEGGLPDFKPNTQKTKTFLQRLELGSNIQFAKNNNLMPTTADVALTLGYKLNDKSVAGIGTGYKLGMGSIDKIRFSTEGISVRSFIDWKLKKQFFISGGWEMNYLTSMPTDVTAIKYDNGWQQAALGGITKKLNIKTKWFKETKLQLLYDFLARQHTPVSQPVLFRVGYSF